MWLVFQRAQNIFLVRQMGVHVSNQDHYGGFAFSSACPLNWRLKDKGKCGYVEATLKTGTMHKTVEWVCWQHSADSKVGIFNRHTIPILFWHMMEILKNLDFCKKFFDPKIHAYVCCQNNG